MADFKKALGKLLKKNKLVIVGIENEDTPNTQILRVELKEKISVTGSMPLPNGAKMVHADNVVYISQPNDHEEGNITEFLKGLPKDDEGEIEFDANGEIVYEGPLKLDVSKPRFINRGGKMEVVKPAKLWLTATRFSAGASTLYQDNRTSTQNEMLKLFGQPVEATVNQPVNSKVEVVAGEDGLDD